MQGDRTEKERAVSARRPVLPVAAGGGAAIDYLKCRKKIVYRHTLAHWLTWMAEMIKAPRLAAGKEKNPACLHLHAGPGPAEVRWDNTVGGGTNLSRQSFN